MGVRRGSRSGGGGGAALSNATPQPPGTPAAGTGTEASRDDHVHARELPSPVALPNGHVATVASGAWTAAAPAGASGATAAEDMSGTGWTTTQPGTVTATWGSGKLVLDAPAGTNTATFVTTNTSRLGASSSQWDMCARVDIVAGDGVSPAAQTLIGFYVDANNYILLSYKMDDRTVGLFTVAAGAFTDHGFVGGPSSGQATGGELWFRVTRLANGTVAVWWGVGVAGAVPTAWTRTHLIDRPALTLAVPTSCSLYVGMGWFGLGPLSAQTTVDVLAIRTTWQGSL